MPISSQACAMQTCCELDMLIIYTLRQQQSWETDARLAVCQTRGLQSCSTSSVNCAQSDSFPGSASKPPLNPL